MSTIDRGIFGRTCCLAGKLHHRQVPDEKALQRNWLQGIALRRLAPGEYPFYGVGCQDVRSPLARHSWFCSQRPLSRVFLPRWSGSSTVFPSLANDFRSFHGNPGDIIALTFSTFRWEPPFYQGLSGPLLCSALRGGIASSWGLRLWIPGPGYAWMLSPKTISSPGLVPLPTDSFASNTTNPKTGYVFRFSFLGS